MLKLRCNVVSIVTMTLVRRKSKLFLPRKEFLHKQLRSVRISAKITVLLSRTTKVWSELTV